jgi:transposase
MKRTQNEKILQIKNETLVVGIDIAKRIHFARAFDNRGIELGKLLRFENSARGFEDFDAWLQGIKQRNGMTEVIVGFEPTGHYWFNLGDHLITCGHKLAIVNPFHVKCARELDDNSPSKSDRKDPKTIAMLVKDGRYRDVYIPVGAYQDLRELVCERERLQERLGSLKNQIVRWLDIYFPEFTTVFKDWSKKAAWLALRHFSTPQRVVDAGALEILRTWREEMKRPSLKKAEQLCLVARQSVGRTEGTRASISNLQFLMTEYELIAMRLESLKEQMEECLSHIPNACYLLAIKGMGVVAAAIIVSEIGDISRFTDPRQLIKYAGLNLRENSSGIHKGKTTISKRGRRRLRHGLFQAMIPILATNEEFRALHKRNTTRSENPLTKMQSLIALCGKLLRVTFALLTKGTAYDPEKLVIEQVEIAQAA